MKKTISFCLLALLSACSNHQASINNHPYYEIEKLLLGNWFVSPLDTHFFEKGNAISSYTPGHTIFFIAYSDTNCDVPLLEAEGTWKIEDHKLIITVTRSTLPKMIPVGLTSIDTVVYIDENNMTLMSEFSDHIQLRTKTSTCRVRHF